jgi:hypothetical protein
MVAHQSSDAPEAQYRCRNDGTPNGYIGNATAWKERTSGSCRQIATPAWRLTDMRRPACLLLLVFLTANASLADAQRVTGSVVHAVSGAPIGGALITAHSAEGDTLQTRATSGDGRFGIAIHANVAYTIAVRSIGMQPTLVRIVARTDTAIRVALEPIPTALPVVHVSSTTQCVQNFQYHV